VAAEAAVGAGDHGDEGGGCAAAGLAVDVAREDPESAAREPYADGVARLAQWMATDEDDGFAALSTLVGALLLARATRGTDVSDRVLAAARAALED
jgi:TetR/AcrR family transcriptional repressor of nem operon